MSNDSVKGALLKYHRRALSKSSREPRRKNKKPEKITESEVMKWLASHHMDCNVVESKAVYSQSAGRYLGGQTDAGFSDIVGNDPDGHALFIELKARGCVRRVSPAQRAFLERKIWKNAFAVVVDSAELLEEIYFRWKAYWRQGNFKDAKKYLLDCIPKPSGVSDDGALFENE